jgi:DNA-binding CsgD family transcriptional regulator
MSIQPGTCQNAERVELSAPTCRKIFRLIHELCELGNDPYAWNTRLLETVADWLGQTQFSMACVIRTKNFDPASLEMPLNVSVNPNGVWERYFDIGDVRDQPNTPWMMARLGTDFAVRRRDIVTDEKWYGSAFYKRVCQPGGWDDMLASQVGIASMDTVHGISFSRAPGDWFTQGEVELVRAVHAELAYLWRRPEVTQVDSLPRRLLETIAAMRRGLSRKEIATELDISPHTVHSYERQLFEKFEVNGRGELLARLASAIRPTLPK